MSRIVTELICKSCGHKWQGYKSFGHPEKTFNHLWKCEKCGAENSHTVEEWINSCGAQNDEVITLNDSFSFVRIFSFDNHGNAHTFPLTSFQWNKFENQEDEDGEGWLTLNEIGNQLLSMFSKKDITECDEVVYVWVESSLYGAIYVFGNYDKTTWYLHAKTNGYA